MNSNSGRDCARTHGAAHRSPIHLAQITIGVQRAFIAQGTHPRPTRRPTSPARAHQLRRGRGRALTRTRHAPGDAAPNAELQRLQRPRDQRRSHHDFRLLIARTIMALIALTITFAYCVHTHALDTHDARAHNPRARRTHHALARAHAARHEHTHTRRHDHVTAMGLFLTITP